jgi:hypothetical protein
MSYFCLCFIRTHPLHLADVGVSPFKILYCLKLKQFEKYPEGIKAGNIWI